MFEPRPPRVFEPIETGRLILRRLADRDLAPFLEYRNDPDVTRFDGTTSMTLDAARQFIDGQKGRLIGVPGVWLQIAIEHRETARLIGDLGFCVDADYPY